MGALLPTTGTRRTRETLQKKTQSDPTGSDGRPSPDRSVLVGLFLVQLFLRLG